MDPGSQHPQSAPNVPESSQGSSSCYYSKASDASTCGEPWPWASAHGAWSLFCPLPHDHVWNSQPTWFCLQANNIEKMSPLGRASKKEHSSLKPRILVLCQRSQASFFSAWPYACFYLITTHEFIREILKPSVA